MVPNNAANHSLQIRKQAGQLGKRCVYDRTIFFQFDAATLTFDAPNISSDISIEFELTVSDGRHEVTQTHSLVVEANSSGGGAGGSIGWLTLLLLPLVAGRRRAFKR